MFLRGGIFAFLLSLFWRIFKMSSSSSVQILTDSIATDTSEVHEPGCPRRTFQADGITSAGAGTADVDIEVSNDNINWFQLGQISLVLSTTAATDGFNSDAPWRYIRARITTITGTDATVNCWMGS